MTTSERSSSEIVGIQRSIDEQATVDARFAEMRDETRLKGGGGGGTSGGVTDDWKADVERQLAQLHVDVRLLLAALIAGFLLLAGGGWALHQSTTAQIQQQAVALSRIEGKIDAAAEARQQPAAEARVN